MIDLAVQEIKTAFTEKWNEHLELSPCLLLDDTWPSVGVLDLLTFSLRLVPEVPPHLQQLTKGAAAYLAVMVHDCWLKIAEQVEVKNTEDGIVVTARGGENLPDGAEATVNIEQALENCLKNLPFPFPVIADLTRPISFDSNVLSLFAVGLMVGLSPAVRGPWRDSAPENFASCVASVMKELARQCANYYERVFPDEPFGQVAELYLEGLVFPPMMVGEALPGTTAAVKLLEYCDAYKLSPASLSKLAHNLALSPDDNISCLGLVLYGALSREIPPPEIIAAAQSKKRFMGLLRRSMMGVRHHFKLAADWVETGLVSENAKRRFDIEESLEFIPWLYLSRRRIEKDAGERKLTPLLIALCDFDMKSSSSILEKLIEEDPTDIELRLQQIKLTMLNGERKRADEMCRVLYSEPESDQSARFFNLWGLCALSLGDHAGAVRCFKAATAIKAAEPALKADLYNNLAWALICAGDTDEALEKIETGLETSICPVTLLLNKGHILWQMKRFDETYAIRERLFKLAPCDRRVFATISLGSAREDN